MIPQTVMNYQLYDYISNGKSNVVRYRDTGDTEPVTVTGPLTQTEGEYHVHVRVLEA